MGRGPPELGCPQSQGPVHAQQEGDLPNAKRSFHRVHRGHADAPLPPLAICTGPANEFTRSVSSPHSPCGKRCDFTNGKNCSSRVLRKLDPGCLVVMFGIKKKSAIFFVLKNKKLKK